MSLRGNADLHPAHPDTVSAPAPTPLLTPTLQRRLSPLETAAAVAIILSCMVAIAMMTGMLPQASHPTASVPAAVRAAVTTPSVMPAVGAITAPDARTSTSAIEPAAVGRAAVAVTGPLPAEPDVATPELPVAAMPAPMPAVQNPAANRAMTFANSRAAPTTAMTAIPSSQRRRLHTAHRHPNPPALQPRGKSREEVVTELLRAKRDGSYSSAMEAYR